VHCASALQGPIGGGIDATVEAASEAPSRPAASRRSRIQAGERSFRVTNRQSASIVFRGGLLVVLCCTLVTVGAGMVSMSGLTNEQYFTVLAWTATAAAIAAWPITPRGLDIERPAFMLVRWGARLGLAMWAVGLWDLAGDPTTRWGPLGLESAGIVGAALLLACGASIAREFELQHTSRRLTTSAVLAVPIGVFTWIMPFPGDRLNIPAGPEGLIAVVFTLFCVCPWWWLLLRTARSIKDLYRETSWTIRAARDAKARDRELAARIREPEPPDRPWD